MLRNIAKLFWLPKREPTPIRPARGSPARWRKVGRWRPVAHLGQRDQAGEVKAPSSDQRQDLGPPPVCGR